MSTQLLQHLQERQNFKSKQWFEQLEERKREEVEFHNFERERHDETVIKEQRDIDVHANKKYYSVSDASKQWVDQWLEKNVRGKVFLDYACGNGIRSIQAARAGAKMAIGLDISDVSVKNARESAQEAGVADRCYFIQGDCEATELPNESVDVVLCCGMLHHLDLTRAYPELGRILVPGGKLLGVEALGHNPFIQLYRRKTPHMRTEWETEHILKMRDVQKAEQFFDRGETRFWHLAVLGAVPFRNSPFFRPAVAVGNTFDSILMATPGIRLLAWQITFELIKRSAYT